MPTRGIDLARRLVETLPGTRPGLFNPWRSRCPHDLSADAASQRLERLGAHLTCAPRFLLVGEATMCSTLVKDGVKVATVESHIFYQRR